MKISHVSKIYVKYIKKTNIIFRRQTLGVTNYILTVDISYIYNDFIKSQNFLRLNIAIIFIKK